MADSTKKRKRASGGSPQKSRKNEAPAPDLTKLMEPPVPSLSSAQPKDSSPEAAPTAAKESTPAVIVRQVADPNAMVYVTGKVTDSVLVGVGCYCSVIKGKRTKVRASALNHLKRINYI